MINLQPYSFSYKVKFFVLIFCLLVFASCRNKKNTPTKQEQTKYQEKLIEVNKYLVKEDADAIRKYIKRRNWQMTPTKTGLWYMIYEQGNGLPAQTGKLATINYKIWLLDGTLCYSSEKSGPKKFRMGRGGVEPGLEEGVLLMHTGDKARMIMPPHLAYGLIGDQNKIPPRSIILYEIELVQISD